jgi:2-phosphoglycerate kinase
MIVLLSYSTSWCQNRQATFSSTGELVYSDSVLISYNDLRKANAKLIELKYEKQINDSLRSIIKNDDIIITKYKQLNANINNKVNKYKKQRNIIATVSSIIVLVCVLFK